MTFSVSGAGPSGDGVVVVLCTAPADEGASLADRLLDAHLAACVNIVPGVESRYRWQGRIECSQEVLLIIKTVAAQVEAVRDALADWHSYDVPEVLVLESAGGLQAYLDWVRSEVAQRPPSDSP